MALQLKHIRSVGELFDYVEPWKRLLQRGGCEDIFYHPLWHLAWWQSIGTRRRMEILIVEENGEWVGLLPLASFRSLRDSFLKVLEFSGGTQADRHDLIVSPGYEKQVLDLFSEPLKKLKQMVSLVRFHSISENSPLLEWQAIMGHNTKIYPEVSPYLPLDRGTSYHDLEQGWSKSHRGDVRRQIRRLSKLGELSLHVLETAEDAISLLPSFFAVHTAKWKKSNWRIRIYNHIIKGFAHQLVNNLWPEGFAHFSTVNLNGKPISYHLGFLYEKKFYYYKPAYVLDYQNYSPGKVHVAMLLQEGCRSGWREFDFLLGEEQYKSMWTQNKREVKTIYFRN